MPVLLPDIPARGLQLKTTQPHHGGNAANPEYPLPTPTTIATTSRVPICHPLRFLPLPYPFRLISPRPLPHSSHGAPATTPTKTEDDHSGKSSPTALPGVQSALSLNPTVRPHSVSSQPYLSFFPIHIASMCTADIDAYSIDKFPCFLEKPVRKQTFTSRDDPYLIVTMKPIKTKPPDPGSDTARCHPFR